MARRKQKMYSGYKPGRNAKGLPIRREEDQQPTTARGLRRQARTPHQHTWILHDTRPLKVIEGYDESRIQNEMRYYCKQSNSMRPNGGGGGAKRGGGKRIGCGECCRPTSPNLAQK